MPLIKLVKVHSAYDDCHGYLTSCHVENDLSDWQEVTEEEMEFLKTYEFERYFKDKKIEMVVFEDVTEQYPEFVDDVKALVKSMKEKAEAHKKKQDELAKKRKLAAEQKKIEKAKKLLAQKGIKVD